MHIPTMGQVWSFTKSNLNFRAKKSVVIQDWRVGLMLRLLQLAVFLLTLAKLFINQEYLSDASPVVTLSMYGNEGEMPEALQREASVYHSNGTHPSALCTRVPLGLYDYVWSADWVYFFAGCKMATKANVVLKGHNMRSMFINTMTTVTETLRVEAPRLGMTHAECQAYITENPRLRDAATRALALDLIDRQSAYDVEHRYEAGHLESRLLGHRIPGSCVTAVTLSYLYAGVDNVSISIDHSASAFGEHFQPYTIIRRYGDDSNQAEFDRADSNVFSLAELLGFASVDLDEPMDGSFNAKWVDTRSAAVGEVVGPEGLSSGNFPRPRITGLRLAGQLAYYNWHQVPGQKPQFNPNDRFGKSRKTVVCILTLRPFLEWTSLGDAMDPLMPITTLQDDRLIVNSTKEINNYRYGVLLTFEDGGKMSRFDGFILLNTLVSAFVMLQSAEVFVAIIASSMLGNKSRLYSELMMEKVSTVTAYSRFVMQIAASCVMFKALDKDGSGAIDAVELSSSIRAVFGNQLSKQESDALVRMTVNVATSDGALSLMNMQDNHDDELEAMGHEVTQTEFVKSFIGPPCTVEGCIAIVKELRQKRLRKQEVERRKSEGGMLAWLNPFARYPSADPVLERISSNDTKQRSVQRFKDAISKVSLQLGSSRALTQNVPSKHVVNLKADHANLASVVKQQRETIDLLLSRVQRLERQMADIYEDDGQCESQGHHALPSPDPPSQLLVPGSAGYVEKRVLRGDAADEKTSDSHASANDSALDTWMQNPTYAYLEALAHEDEDRTSHMGMDDIESEEARRDEMSKIFQAIDFARTRLTHLASTGQEVSPEVVAELDRSEEELLRNRAHRPDAMERRSPSLDFESLEYDSLDYNPNPVFPGASMPPPPSNGGPL